MNDTIKTIEDKLKKGERVEKFSIELDHLSTGERRHLHELMYAHGPGNGRIMLLPIDQGLEHGPRDFFVKMWLAKALSRLIFLRAVIRKRFAAPFAVFILGMSSSLASLNPGYIRAIPHRLAVNGLRERGLGNL